MAAPITAIGGSDVLVALGSGPFSVGFWFCVVFACFLFLRGSIRISDRGKCISTQRWFVGCCFLLQLVVQVTRFYYLLLLLFYFHLQDRATELNRPNQRKKKGLEGILLICLGAEFLCLHRPAVVGNIEIGA